MDLNEDERKGKMRMVEVVEHGEEVDQHRVITNRGLEKTVMNTEELGEEVEQQLPVAEKMAEEPTVQQDEILEIVKQIDTEVEPSTIAEIAEEIQVESTPLETATVNEPIEEAEQPLLTPKEVAANLAARNYEATEMDMEADGDRTAGWNSTERVGRATDETLETREEEHPSERLGTSPAEGIATSITAPESREVVIINDEGEEAEQVPPRDEAAGARAAAIRTY